MPQLARKLKVLHFMPENFVWGGIETYLKLMLPILATNGTYELTAVVTQDSQLYHALKHAGIRVHGIPFPFRKKSLIRSAWVNPWLRSIDISVYAYLWPILKKEQPDLVHIHNGRLEQALIRLAGYPIVYTYHGYGGLFSLEGAPNVWIKAIYKLFMPFFSALIPHLSGMTIVSEYERQRLYREGFLTANFNTEVLYNGLPTQTLLSSTEALDSTVLRRELGISHDARIILFACRLQKDRNPELVLKLARRLLTDSRLQYPVHFLVAGDGKLANVFQDAFTNDPLLKGHGQYLGFRKDIPQLIKASTLTISTSLQEGFGLRVLESLLFGKPCITYAAGGIPEVMSLPEASRWLVPLHDEEAFAEQLLEVINLPQTELDRLAPVLQDHAQRFDIKTHVQKLEDFYNRTFHKLAAPKKSGTVAYQPARTAT